MRRPFTTKDAYEAGVSRTSLRWRVERGTLQRIGRGVYLEGGEPPTPFECALGIVVATDAVASHSLAGVLHDLDGLTLRPPFASLPHIRKTRLAGLTYRDIADDDVTLVSGYRCTTGTRTMIDLASVLDDLQWEQALESALRKQLTTIERLTAAIASVKGAKRIRRVLAGRPRGAPPTESLLETLMVQLIRTEPRLPIPDRQVIVLDQRDRFVARVDLAWPEHGIFLELDGHHHKDQPAYDANRQTRVVTASAWRPARFTWYEVRNTPKSTLRQLMNLFENTSRTHHSR